MTEIFREVTHMEQSSTPSTAMMDGQPVDRLATPPSGSEQPGTDAWSAGLQIGSAVAILDAFAAAMCVVEADRRVRLINRAARELAAGHDCLTIRDGRLCGVNPRVTRRLDRSLEIVFGLEGLPDAFQIPSRCLGRALQIGIRALPAAAQLGSQREPLALLIAAPSEGAGREETILRSLFGLSRSEAAVLTGLLAGRSLEECALERGVALSTVRSQLKSIFNKTNTTSQAQLMIVAQALPGMTAAGSERVFA